MKRFLFIILISIVFTACDEIVDQTENESTVTKDKSVEQVENIEPDKEKETKDDLDDKQTVKQVDLSGLTVHFIDVGQGDATLFTYEDYVVLLDAGDWKDTKALDYLKQQKIETIDLAIITHPHSDHMGQLTDIIKEIDVKEVWMSENTHTSKTYENALQAMLDHDVTYHEPKSGDIETIGSLQLHVLHPSTLSGDLNEDSISLRASYGNVHFVFTGDAYKKNEAEMMQRHDHLEAQILHLGHHGSNTSTSQAFLDTVNPDVAIYSAGKDNMYGHPHREVVERVTSSNITLLGTSEDGTILVKTDGNTYEIETSKQTVLTGKGKKDQNQTKGKKSSPKVVDIPEPTEKSIPKTNSNKQNKVDHDCININEADVDKLTKIIHIGDKRAKDLIDKRPYETVKDLQKINGIGTKRVEDIEKEGLACVS